MTKANVLETLKNNAKRGGGRRLKDRSYVVKTQWEPELSPR